MYVMECDVMSFYVSICKCFKFLIGHPTIYVGDTCVDKEACLMKCTTVPPKDLYHPIILTTHDVLTCQTGLSCSLQLSKVKSCIR
jgi:hypothetical protein